MRLVHRSLLYLASAVSLSLAACGGGDDGDEGDDGGGPVVGEHHQYVVSKMTLPEGANTALKLDIDGNGTKENKLGNILFALTSQSQGQLDLQASLDRGVNNGDITLLTDVQATDLGTAKDAGLRVFLGEIVSPEACLDPEDDTTCGKHLLGTGMFTATANDSLVAGDIVGGRFTGGPGKLTLQLSLEGTLIALNLINAKAELTVTADGIMNGLVGGAITKDELDTNVIPAIATTVDGIVKGDCTEPNPTPPACGCPASSTGKTLLGLFDTAPEDCSISLEEIRENSFIKTVLGPDLDILDPKGQNESLSVGVGITSVKATYAQPPE